MASRHPWPVSLTLLGSVLGSVVSAIAHGVGHYPDLSVPLWLYTVGAVATVAVSLLVVGVLVVRTRRTRALAWRTQSSLLVLLVSYLVSSLWLLAQPIVEEPGSASRVTIPTVRKHSAVVLTVNPGIPPEPLTVQARTLSEAQARLAAVLPLRRDGDDTTDVTLPTSVLCFCLHKGPETIQELRRLAAERFMQGLAAFQDGRYTDALTAFSKAIELHPRDSRAYTNRGLSSGWLGDYQQAYMDFTRAIGLDAQQAQAYYARGLVAMLLGDVPQARQDLQHAADLGEARALHMYDALRFSSSSR